jgi:hypothetical protein
VAEGVYEPLITPERHLAAVAVFLRERATNSTRHEGKVTPLSGKVICAECGYRMQFHRILSRPGTAPTFRCRREGCRLYGRRIRYAVLLEKCRQHLLGIGAQVQEALVAAFSPAVVDPDLEKRVAEAERRVESRRALVADDPADANLQRALATAESTLAALLAARNDQPAGIGGDALLKVLGALVDGALVVPDGEDGRLRVLTDPDVDLVGRLVERELWEANAGLLVGLLIHSLRVDAVSGAVEVIAASGTVLPVEQAMLHIPWVQLAT